MLAILLQLYYIMTLVVLAAKANDVISRYTNPFKDWISPLNGNCFKGYSPHFFTLNACHSAHLCTFHT